MATGARLPPPVRPCKNVAARRPCVAGSLLTILAIAAPDEALRRSSLTTLSTPFAGTGGQQRVGHRLGRRSPRQKSPPERACKNSVGSRSIPPTALRPRHRLFRALKNNDASTEAERGEIVFAARPT